jgi:hypothetical protein
MNTKMKKIIQGTILGTLVFMSGVTFVFAQNNPLGEAGSSYTVLAPLPGTTNDPGCQVNCTADLSSYLPGLFNLLIGVGAISAFVIITIYGLETMLTDSLSTKLQAKEMLTNALWGLGLIIFAYVILYTINPNLINGDLNITTPAVATSGGVVAGTNGGNAGNVAGVAMTQTAIDQSNAVRTDLQTNYGIDTYAGPCTQGQTTGCVDLNGLNNTAYQGLAALKQACGGTSCEIDISGGTEAGHSADGAHPVGSGVDILPSPQLTSYLTSLGAQAVPGQGVNVTINGQSAYVLYEADGTVAGGSTSNGNHWHISF